MRKNIKETITKVLLAGIIAISAAVTFTGCDLSDLSGSSASVYDPYYTVHNHELDGEWVSSDGSGTIIIDNSSYTLCDTNGSVIEKGTVKGVECDCINREYKLFPDDGNEGMRIHHIYESDDTERLERDEQVSYILSK